MKEIKAEWNLLVIIIWLSASDNSGRNEAAGACLCSSTTERRWGGRGRVSTMPCVDLRCSFYMTSMRPSISLKDVTLRGHPIGFLLSLLIWPLAFGFVA